MGAVERARGFLALADALAAALPADRDGAHLAPRRSLAAQQRPAPRPPGASRFLYPQPEAQPEPQPGMPQLEAQSEAQPGEAADGGRFAAAVRALAPDAAAFYARVRAWVAVPAALARLPPLFEPREGAADALVDRKKLERWLAAELGRYLDDQGGKKAAQEVDRELVEFVAGLLELPDYCEPTLLALELHEFLGDKAEAFALALWKFLVVEIAVVLVFRNDGGGGVKQQPDTRGLSNSLSAELLSTHRSTSGGAYAVPMMLLSSSVEFDYKRRPASYRGKVGTKAGREALRELIEKEMAALGQADGRCVVSTITATQRGQVKEDSTRAESDTWMLYTDALLVRDMGRNNDIKHQLNTHQHRSSKRRERSRSRSRGRDKQPRSRSRGSHQRSRSRSSSSRSSQWQRSRDPAPSHADRGRNRYPQHRRQSRSRSQRRR